jgi:hypothetical protein
MSRFFFFFVFLLKGENDCQDLGKEDINFSDKRFENEGQNIITLSGIAATMKNEMPNDFTGTQ